MHKKFGLVTVLALVLLTAGGAWAEATISATRLRTLGVDVGTFEPITFTQDGHTLIGMDRGTLKDKEKGVMFHLWIFHLDVMGDLDNAQSVPLHIPSFEQGCLTPDQSKFVIISDVGTRYLIVDLSTLKVTDLMKPKLGTPGFRAEPTILWTVNGKLLTTGYFYDKNRYAGDNTIATIDPSLTGVKAFTKGPDITKLKQSIPHTRVDDYNSQTMAYFGWRDGDDTVLNLWRAGKGIKEIDRAHTLVGLWNATTRLLYSVVRSDGQCDLVVYDGSNGKRWNVATSKTPYHYLFLSHDGSTVIAGQFHQSQDRMDVYYAKQDDDFTITRVSGMQDVSVGWLRVSPTGRYLALYNPLGIKIVGLP